MISQWFSGTRPRTIRAQIRWLVVACIVPAWLLTAAAAWMSYEREREGLANTTVQASQMLMQAVERELAIDIVALQTLATSTRIDDLDYARFRERAEQVTHLNSATALLLVDPGLNVLVGVPWPEGKPLPRLPQDRFPHVMTSGRPAASDLFVGSTSGSPQLAVAAPVLRDGRAIGRLEMISSPARFSELLERQPLPAGWTAAVLDRQGVLLARNLDAGAFVGKPAPAVLLAELQLRDQGSRRGRTLDGIDVISGFSHSAEHGWTAVVGVPESVLNADLRRTLLRSALAASALLAIGLALAGRIGKSIADPIQALVAPALAIGRGEAATVSTTALRETNELGVALQQAAGLLRERGEARAQAEVALHESESRLRMALDSSRIGDWELDLRTNVLQHSARHDRCFGHAQPVADWSVAHFVRQLHPDDLDTVNQRFREVRQSGAAWQLECRVYWPDGSVHWLDAHGVGVTENGRLTRILGLITDITERKLGEELRLHGVRLEAENRQIQEANRLKSEFLANMSHELRTPLNAVIGFAEILRSGAVSDDSQKRDEYLGYIAASGRHLLQLINDVLDLSKVESGKFEFFPEPVDLPKVLKEVAGVLQGEAARKGITVAIKNGSGLEGLSLDPSRLKQVLYNFLSNAIKFTGHGGRVVLRSSAEGPDQLRLEVEDNGIGIAASDQALLFTPFQQINAGTAKQHQGTGLGLALTRRLAELQGGSVGLRSKPGEGSVFFVLLPCRASAARQPQPQPQPQPQSPSPSLVSTTSAGSLLRPGAPRVLVIEDDVSDQARLVQLLGTAGFQVDVAGTGEAALRLFASRRYDAITLDLLLPDRSGLEVLATLRESADNGDVPVVVVTMVTETSSLAGFRISDVLTKPIRPDEVVGALRRAGLRTAAAPRVMVVDDEASARDLMAATLQSIGITALCMADGRSALAGLDEHRPDAMVLDLMMPGLNGFDVLHALRQRPEYLQLPVFIWTSMNLSPAELAGLASSAHMLVSKGQGGIETLAQQIRGWRAGRQGVEFRSPPEDENA